MPVHLDNMDGFTISLNNPAGCEVLSALFDAVCGLPFTEPNCSADEDCDLHCECGDCEDCCECEDKDCEEWPSYSLPLIETVIFSGPATTIIWSDGDKTTVKVAEGQEFDRYAGFCAAIVKKLFGSSSAAKKIMDECDADLQRQLRAARIEAEKKKKKEAELAAKAKKAVSMVPSYADFQTKAYQRAIDKYIDEMADDIVQNIRARVKAKEIADMLAEKHTKEED